MAQANPPPNPEPRSMRLRATAVLVVVVCLFATLFGRLWYLQGVEANTVAVKSVAGQGIETVYVPAPRGEIFDRNGALLAGNSLEQVVTVAPGAETAHPGIIEELSALLGQPVSKVKAEVNNVQYSPYQSVPVVEGVSNAVVLAIDENQSLLPGVSVQAEPVRFYPQGETTANIVGYVSGITGPEYDAQQERPVRRQASPVIRRTRWSAKPASNSPSRSTSAGRRGSKRSRSTRRATCWGRSVTRPPYRATTSSFRSRWQTNRRPCRRWTIGC